MRKIVGLLLLLLLQVPSGIAFAHHCELIGWHENSGYAVLYCLQACLESSCPGYERLVVVGPNQFENIFSIFEENPQAAEAKPRPQGPKALPVIGTSPSAAPDPMARIQALPREKKIEAYLEMLRKDGFQIQPFQITADAGGRYRPDPQGLPGGVALEKVTHSAGSGAECGRWTRFLSLGSQLVIPFQLSWEGVPPQQGLLEFTVVSCEGQSSNEQGVTYRVDYLPLSSGTPFAVADSVRLEISPWVAGASRAETPVLEYAISPRGNTVFLRHVIPGSQGGVATTEGLVNLNRLVQEIHMQYYNSQSPYTRSRPEPRYYQGDFGSNLAEYFGMYKENDSIYAITMGMSPTDTDYKTVSVLDFSIAFTHHPVVGCGLAMSMFSYWTGTDFQQPSNLTKNWSILGFGPVVRFGRLQLQLQVDLLSFRIGKSWLPGLRARASFPLVTHREWRYESSFIPVPVVGLDTWFDDSLQHERSVFWLGLSWLGNSGITPPAE